MRLVVIVGPTASGKSALGVKLAKEFDGEVVSADSRQVYEGLDLLSGKISAEEMEGVPHHCLNIAPLASRFTVKEYKEKALLAIGGVIKRGRLPFLVGGSPLYAYAVADGAEFPEIPPNPRVRADLQELSVQELFSRLLRLDPERAATIEPKNKRRLVRALEIIQETGRPVPKQKRASPFDLTMLGLNPPNLRERIERRARERISKGLLKEARDLHKKGVPYERFEELGMDAKCAVAALRGAQAPLEECLIKSDLDLAKRQLQWFKKDPRVRWVSGFREARALLTA